MSKTNEMIDAVEKWLKTGEIHPEILSDELTFSSPYWKHANKQQFLDKFLDPTEYIEKSLSNIVGYSPIIRCQSACGYYFTLTFTYDTKNGCHVDEAILCEVKEGLLYSMRSIYDLEQTKKAHEL